MLDISNQQIISAYLAGLLSFFAPCLLPLFPSYFSVITGFTFSELYGLSTLKIRSRIFFSSLIFILGFSIVFTLMGLTGSFIGVFLTENLSIILRVSGILLIILGLIQTGVINFEILRFDYAWNIQKRVRNMGFLTAFVTGVISALSWIPCIGPLLSPILLLATQSQTALRGAVLLFIYAQGLSLPFILGGLFFPKIVDLLQVNLKFFKLLSRTAGIILIVFGALLSAGLYQDYINAFNNFIYKIFSNEK